MWGNLTSSKMVKKLLPFQMNENHIEAQEISLSQLSKALI